MTSAPCSADFDIARGGITPGTPSLVTAPIVKTRKNVPINSTRYFLKFSFIFSPSIKLICKNKLIYKSTFSIRRQDNLFSIHHSYMCYNNFMFYFDTINGKKFLKSDFINGNAECFFTTRETVIKTKEQAFENLVEENKNLICDFLRIKRKNLISPKQTHTSHVEIAKEGKSDYPDTDGLILNNKEQAVYLNFADCTPVILYDKKQNYGAVVHAGWRGTAGKIAAKDKYKYSGSNKNK